MKLIFNIYGTWRQVTFEKLMMKMYDFFYSANSVGSNLVRFEVRFGFWWFGRFEVRFLGTIHSAAIVTKIILVDPKIVAFK